MLKLAACFAAFLAVSSCAAVVSSLPTIIAYVQDGSLVVNTIARFVDQYFTVSPNAELQGKIDSAISRTNAALDLVLRAASGTGKINQGKVDEAIADFRQAYTDLLALVAPLGVRQGTSGLLRSTPAGGLIVPTPLALKI